MDQLVIYAFQTLIGRWPLLDDAGIFFAVGVIWLEAALLAVFVLLDRRRYFAALTAFASAVAAWAVNQGIGLLWFRPRPFAELPGVHEIIGKSALDKSFPSDHSSFAFALAAAVFLVDRRWGSVFLVLAALIAVGRVYVGVHYPTDVIAGASVGIACAYAVHRLAHRYLGTRHKDGHI